MKSDNPATSPRPHKSMLRMRGFALGAALLASLGLSGGRAHAAVEVQLSPSHAAPRPVGTTVVWTASATDTNPGGVEYRFGVRPPGGGFAVTRDFAASNSFEWTPGDREGDYDILVTVRNKLTRETAQRVASFTVSSRVTGDAPVVSGTGNPLIALYSAPPCDGGSMRVRFRRAEDSSSQTTPWKLCRPGVSMNFYVAGMLAATRYVLQHEVISGPSIQPGPPAFFTTGMPSGSLPSHTVLVPAGPQSSLEQGVLLNVNLGVSATATDLEGRLLWYYDGGLPVRPSVGGAMLVIPNGGEILREVDVAGNTLRETNVARVSEQLNARGEQSITSFHHDAMRLPDGNVIVLCSNERMGDQGDGPVAIIGDALVVLDKDLQVVWSWNAFDHLDVRRKAVLGEVCVRGAADGCPPFSLAQTANDWLHSNSIGYVPSDGGILLSVRNQDWVIKIDYRDGKGAGDVLWRLGKDGDFAIISDDPYPWFSHQHDAEYELGGSRIMSIYDNGNTRFASVGQSAHSRGQVLNIDEQNRTVTLEVNSDLGDYAFAVGCAQRLANGNYHFLSGFLRDRNFPNEFRLLNQSIEVLPSGAITYNLQGTGPNYRSFRMRSLYALNVQDQAIGFAAIGDKSYGDAPFTLEAIASSGLPVTFSILSGPAMLSGKDVTVTGVGPVTVRASQVGDQNYTAAPTFDRTFNVGKAKQTITFGAIEDRTFGDPDFGVSASASSGLGVSFSAAGSCTVSGSTVHITGAGFCTVMASQPGDANYDAATPVEQSFAVARAPQAITFGALPEKTYGDAPFNVSAAGGASDNPVTFSASGNCAAGGANGATITINGAGACTVTASQAGDSNYMAAADVGRFFVISKVATTTSLSSSSNPSGAEQPVTFTAVVTSAAVTPAGQVEFKVNGASVGDPAPLNSGGIATLTTSALAAGSYTVTADYGGGPNFNASTGTLGGAQAVGSLFEFSLPLYAVGERAGSVTVAVRRTGDAGSAASVVYATDDGSIPSVSVPCSSVTGLALGRCDYTGAAGRLHFAAGEVEKTFVVLVNDDSFVEGTEATLLRLSGASVGAALAPRLSATLEITDDQPESVGNPSNDDEAFVRQHYHDFLGREPDAAGLKFWTDGIKACGPDAGWREVKRVHTSAAFFLSIEFQNTGFFAYRMHRAASGDVAGSLVPISFEHFTEDTQAIGREVIVGQLGWEQKIGANKAAFALEFVQRPEFLARYPAQMTAAAFVDMLNANGRGVLTDAERSALVSELSPNPADVSLRASVLRKVAENAQFVQVEFNRAFVLMEYFGYLRRNPNAAPDADFSGYNFWLAKLNEFNGDFVQAEMVKAFISSDEYRKRFGQ